MKVTVDYDMCASTGACMQLCPEVFEVRKDGYLYVLQDEPPADLAEAGEVARVARKVEAARRAGHGPARPEARAVVGEPATAPVLRRHESDVEARDGLALPPLHLDDASEAGAPEPATQALRHAVHRVRPQSFQRGRIHMIEVIVGHQHHVDLFRQCVPVEPRRHIALDHSAQ